MKMGVEEGPVWETFLDVGYFDMWCVRRVGERTFGQGFHVANEAEARQLCNLLNELSQAMGADHE